MSFTLGGVTADDLKIRMLEDSQIPILPPTVDRIVQIPLKNGAYDFGADLGPRPFNLSCAFVDAVLTDNAALQQAVRVLAAHLVDAHGKPRDMTLVFDMEPDAWYIVRYSGDLPIERILYHSKGFFNLPLLAADPFAHADLSLFDDPPIEYDDGHIYPNPPGFTWEYIWHMSSAYNYGIATALKFEITGTATNPKVINVTTGEDFSFPSISPGDGTVEIDSNDYVPDFLMPGENGLIFEADTVNAETVFTWEHNIA